ncbi:MAG: hypothetical protein N2319_13280 [Candidatus Kapabacteria bacterium]|nr:hypothetical protein [Candidatus Kapabacteria bacterium]
MEQSLLRKKEFETCIYNILGECILSTPSLRASPQEGKIWICVWLKPNSERTNGPRPEGRGYSLAIRRRKVAPSLPSFLACQGI